MNIEDVKKNYKGAIKSVDEIAKETYKLTISSKLDSCAAGQFISILCPNKTFRRPFSISGFDFDKNELTILFKLKGEGTDYLRNLKAGDDVDFLAPLGNGFKIENKKALLVGAGIGIAPMLFLKDELNKSGIENYLISGFKTQDEVIKGSDETKVGGSVLDNLENLIIDKNFEIIYSCGPAIVLRLLSQLVSKYNLQAQLALEKVMACSIGVCRGCVIKLNRNNETITASVCKDGPVFKSSEIIWE